MSPIGRIFIVLNLVLAAAFLGWAASALSLSQEWKTKHDDLTDAKDALEESKDRELSQLRVDLNAAKEALDRAEEERDLAKANATQLQSDLEEARREVDQLGSNLTSIAATLDDFRATIAQVSEARDRAESERREAVEGRDAADDTSQEAELARRDAEDALAQAQNQIADLEAGLNTARGEASSLQTQLAILMERTGTPIGDIVAVPLIEGTVVTARYDDSVAPGLVALNVGSADGVKRGFTFEIYSGNAYKGRISVRTVEENRCAGVITTAIEGRQMQSGDRATTRL